ncbi:hypothetical protein GCM10009811_28330 [Nostocoides veronense]|uniref:Secreted protein n=1 Tax=Nostocoides veronense TaxID=330836 RepID=A0ABN2LY35_9MICO
MGPERTRCLERPPAVRTHNGLPARLELLPVLAVGAALVLRQPDCSYLCVAEGTHNARQASRFPAARCPLVLAELLVGAAAVRTHGQPRPRLRLQLLSSGQCDSRYSPETLVGPLVAVEPPFADLAAA